MIFLPYNACIIYIDWNNRIFLEYTQLDHNIFIVFHILLDLVFWDFVQFILHLLLCVRSAYNFFFS